MEAAVIGAGTMGSGIAQLLAQSGFQVALFDLAEDILSRAEGRIASGLRKSGKSEALSAVRKTTRLEDLSGCELVIEAAAESLDVKRELFKRVEGIVSAQTVLATNTSSLSVGSIASGAVRPERVLGLHFFNPAPVMRLVEVVRAPKTSDKTVEFGVDLARCLGKTAVVCKDTPGFIANRVARPFYLQGMSLLERGAGSPEAIDRAVRELGGFRMGPLELVDLIGLEVNLTITTAIFEALGRPERLKPSEAQVQLAARGCFGQKSGKGFYLYEDGRRGAMNPVLREILPKLGANPLAAERIFGETLDAVIEEARRAAREGVASEADIDTAMMLGLNWPKGPLTWEKELSRRS